MNGDLPWTGVFLVFLFVDAILVAYLSMDWSWLERVKVLWLAAVTFHGFFYFYSSGYDASRAFFYFYFIF